MINALSDQDLLAILVGKREAKRLSRIPIHKLFGMHPSFGSAVSESCAQYQSIPEPLLAAKELFARAFSSIMEQDDVLVCSQPDVVGRYLSIRIGHLQEESFWALWLNSQNQLITAEEISRGTINASFVYPRVVVKKAIQSNAASVIFGHNHPSGVLTPSESDQIITHRLRNALDLIDVRVLDHFVVSGNQFFSMAQNGLI